MKVMNGIARGFAVVAVGVLLAGTGCATKKFVNKQVGQVDQRVSGVETQVEDAQERITATSKTAQEALERAVAAGKLAAGKLLYETVLSDDKVKFGFNRKELSPEAQTALNQFADQLKAENRNVYIEIQGHTDGVGGDRYNEELGMARADAARYFLSKHGIPLHRMNTISYGESEPVADNASREGRAQNRRVVLVVLM